MNIFASDINPKKSAINLDDKRVVKMVLESAQLLSTAISVCGEVAPYKPTHKNHPCSVWVRKTRSNYLWLLEHFKYLCQEYTARYNKTHKCEKYLTDFHYMQKWIPDGPLTTHPNCTIFKGVKNVYLAYKLCLNDKWCTDIRTPTWYGGPVKCLK